MIDRLLGLGACFDWISPIYAFVKDISHGGGHAFVLDRNCGHSAKQVERLLRRNGIETWGLMVSFDGKEILLCCPKEQAIKATGILLKIGVPINAGAVGSSGGGKAEAIDFRLNPIQVSPSGAIQTSVRRGISFGLGGSKNNGLGSVVFVADKMTGKNIAVGV